MNKKSKAIISVIAVTIIATILGVLCWGLQPVKRDKVSLKKLNKELGAEYCMPSELPFEGDVECFIIYNEFHWNLRFEIDSNDATGYSIKLKDGKREINIVKSELASISGQESVKMEKYNNHNINYTFRTESDIATDNLLIIQFGIDGKAYQIEARYNKDVNSETLKSDMECLLDQMIER